MYEECIGLEVVLFASFGDVKSKRSRLGPAESIVTALKCPSETGQNVFGKQSSERLIVKLPSIGVNAGSAIVPYSDRAF